MKPSIESVSSRAEKPFEGLPEEWLVSHELVVDIFTSFRDDLVQESGSIDHTRKADSSYLTYMDRHIERVLKSALAESFPQFGFEGEETGKSGDASRYWLVDPIDGTASFIRGTGRSTNMAALMVEGEPVISTIYDFVNDKLYTAAKGRGAYCNGEKIQVSDKTLDEAFVDNASARYYPEVFAMLRPYGVRVFQPVGAVGRSLVDVARGSSEGYVVLGTELGNHDLMPGLLIAKEAGAEVVSLDNEAEWDPLQPGNFAVVTPVMASILRAPNLEGS